MKKITKGLCLLLTIVMCLTVTQPVYAKTKYTKAEKKLAFTLACYQDDLLYPERIILTKLIILKAKRVSRLLKKSRNLRQNIIKIFKEV